MAVASRSMDVIGNLASELSGGSASSASSAEMEPKPTLVTLVGVKVGTTLLKNFEGHGSFKGEITEINEASGQLLYHVVYEDGDSEDLTG